MTAKTTTWDLGDQTLADLPAVFDGLGAASSTRRGARTVSAERSVLGSRFVEIDLDRIVEDNRVQARRFDPDQHPHDQALVDSIAEVGQKKPIRVQEVVAPDGGPGYRIVGGHRRVGALRQLGRPRVLAIVAQDSSEDEDLNALIDNMAEPLTLLELGKTLLLIQERHGLTMVKIAALSGISRQRLHEVEQVLSLNAELQTLVEDGTIRLRAGAALQALGPEDQAAVAAFAPETLTVAQATEVVQRVKGGDPVRQALRASGVRSSADRAGVGPAGVGQPGPTAHAGKHDAETRTDGFAGEWLEAHYRHLDRAVLEKVRAAVSGQKVDTRTLRMTVLLAATSCEADLFADASMLAMTETGRVLVQIEERIERLIEQDARGRFTRGCTPVLGELVDHLTQVQSRRQARERDP
jgi:ParB/RepB/Spo0J family partition protein